MESIESSSYRIYFIEAIDAIVSHITQQYPNVKFCILTDDNLSHLYLNEIQASFQKAKRQYVTFILNHGEINKTRYQKQRAENFLFQNKFERDDILISVGGGLVGDFTGYLASTYLRGIRYIQVPTTVLGMVDASIGSKTGVNTEYGKNLIGAIYDPVLIVININFLKTLDHRNVANGLAEMIKAALLFDKDYFHQLEKADIASMMHLDPTSLKTLIKRSIELKLKVVNADKREHGLRKLLNFGHTIGHGIEYTLKGELLHGECVAIGMCIETEIAYNMGLCDESLLETIRACCKEQKLPTDIPSSINIDSVIKYMENDKKNKASDIHFVFLQDVAKAYEKTFPVSREIIKRTIASSYAVGPTKISDPEKLMKIKFPGSKSITNRVLLMAALGDGVVKLQGVLEAEDTHIMLNALKNLQACEVLEKSGDTFVIKGNRGQLQPPKESIYTENSGTSARFLTSVLLMINGSAVMDGSKRMRERPIGDLLDALRLQKNVQLDFLEKENQLPFKVTSQGFYGGEIRIKSKISSQFVSSILMSAPYALNPVKLILEDIKEDDKIVSEPYIQMTVSLMEKFGIKVNRAAYNIFEVPQGVYTNPKEFEIEPDASTASYDVAMLCLNNRNGKILHLGSESVQGDAGFAGVVQKAGANISILPTSIEVKEGDIKNMKPLDINLANQTDTFMTLAVILSQIKGVSYIRGIANQRVKECDRIRAVCKNLAKCGIYCKELDDGLEIHGQDINEVKQQSNSQGKRRVLIKTYDDHRIAMSFAVLGNYFANNGHHLQLVIQNRACVGKTFPGFWKHLNDVFGVNVDGLNEDEVNRSDIDNNDPVFIIGMRYAGKTTFGQILAEKTGRKFIDMDVHVIQGFKQEDQSVNTVQDVVEKYSWKTWRDLETKFLEDVLSNYDSYRGYVISTGGGIVEIKRNLEILRTMKNIFMVDRPYFDIEKESVAKSKNDTMRPHPSTSLSLSEIYIKRLPNFIKFAKKIFSFPTYHEVQEKIKLNETEYWAKVTKKYNQFHKKVLTEEFNPFIPDDSFFLTVDLRTLENLSPHYAKYINAQYNALELRIDYFVQENRDRSLNEIFRLLREKISYVKFLIDIPLLLTLRTQKEGGSFEVTSKADNDFIQKLYFLLNKTNLIDIFDIEYSLWSNKVLRRFRGKATKKLIILSKHYPKKTTDNHVLQDIEVMNECEEADILKIVLNEGHNLEILDQVNFEKPLIKLKLGNSGKMSRVDCKFLCPVFDPLFGAGLAPGQMSKQEILETRLNTGLTPRFKTFYLFGNQITNSLSPIIHNTYFSYHNLFDCHFVRKEVQTIEEVIKVIKEDPYFKGCAITMPFKKEILPYLDQVHSVAKELGVVNTVVKFCGQLHGFNADWNGIYNPLKTAYNQRQDLKGKPYGLVIGAGATAETAIYTLQKLGMNIVVYNRSRDRIIGLKDKAPGIKICTSLENLTEEGEANTTTIDPSQIAIIISTVPGNNDIAFPSTIFANNPIIFDVSYKPRETRFITEARKNNCGTIIYGIEMLLNQGYVQDEYFCGKKAPKKIITEAVMKYYEQAMAIYK